MPGNQISIGSRKIGENLPTYFIADIAANHDGDLMRAKSLILLANQSGADAVKFQHHNVSKYVSDKGFRSLGAKFSHQSQWEKSIFEVYQDAQVPLDWTLELKNYCQDLGIEFFTTPYDIDLVDELDQYVPAFKIGSGDLAWDEMLTKVASKGKPVLFATGASTLMEVIHAHDIISQINSKIILMQCNTNYTASPENYKHINLNVLNTYRTLFPSTVLGLSDHTQGCETVLGAITLGARVIEKHFTDDNNRLGPDHPFSMDPSSWEQMVSSARLLEMSLGSTIKRVELNEADTFVLQRRAIRIVRDLRKGDKLTRDCIEFKRPCPDGALAPNDFFKVEGKTLNKDITSESCITHADFFERL